ncbi:MAG: T9SS type A sorting domain-containing protein [Chitinophagales bacterium]|nr:T9SS type A sorting domain-containing protein [Chitinophagales bacterium]
MKKITLMFVPFVVGLTAMILFNSQTTDSVVEKQRTSYSKKSKDKRIQEAIKYTSSFRINEHTGKVEVSDYYKAVQAADQLKNASNKSTGALALDWENMGPDNVGGRTRAILIDRSNSKVIYAGGVGGGMWKSTDGGNNWTISSNGLENLNVASIAQATDGTIYIGMGEGLAQAEFAGTEYHSGNPGNGMYKSTDGGASWQHLPSTAPLVPLGDDWADVNRIACDPNDPLHILVANGGGIAESKDGGLTWTEVLASLSGGSNRGKDLQYAAGGGTLFASVDARLFKSTDNGTSWNQIVGSSGFPSNNVWRIEIATAPSNPNYVYCSVAANSGCLNGIYRSKDQGVTWQNIGPGGSTTFEPFGTNCQGWYDNTIAVMPDNEDRIYMGGITYWSYSSAVGWTRADQREQSFNHTNPFWIHADKHMIVFDKNNPDIMYIGSDGGIFKSTNASKNFPEPTYTFKNKNFNVTQFYSVAAAFTGEMLGGTQDNGTQFLNYRSNSPRATFEVFGGDGGYTDISRIKPEIFVTATTNADVIRSGNSGSSFGGFFDVEIDPDGDGEVGATGVAGGACSAPFIAYTELFERYEVLANYDSVEFTADKDYGIGEAITVNSNENEFPFLHFLTAPLTTGQTIKVVDKVDAKFLLSTNCGLWMTPDLLNIGVSARWFRIATGVGTILSADITPDGNTVYAGSSNGTIYRIDGIASFNVDAEYPDPSQGMPAVPVGVTSSAVDNLGSGGVTGVYIDKTNPSHILATTGGYGSSDNVWKATNGSNFNPIQSNLPDMPVYDGVIDANNSMNYIIGTELGVWSSNDGGLTWSEENSGMERVATYRLRQVALYDDACPVLYLGTHGRGFFRSVSLTPGGCKTTVPDDITGINDPSTTIDHFNIYPNPVVNNATIELALDNNAEVEFLIVDMAGRVVKSFNYGQVPKGENRLDFDVNGISAASYAGTLIANGRILDSRVVIVK